MNYDISTIENCRNTLQLLTNFYYWDDLYDIYKYTYPSDPDKIREEIIKQNNIYLNVSTSDIYFVLLHITTSANGCLEIKRNGIHDLEWVLENDTELKRFLIEHDIYINVSQCTMTVNNDKYDISDSDVGFKLYKDKDICGSFQINKRCPYEGNVHIRPEILMNVDKYVKGKNLCNIWQDTHNPYIVKFKVPYYNMDIAFEMSIKDGLEENVLDRLLEKAMDTFFYKRFNSEEIGILKRNVFVPSNDIISIVEY